MTLPRTLPRAALLLLPLLAACARTPKPPPVPGPPPEPATCTTSADCAEGELCVGPPGCDATWTCQPDVICTMDLRPYCTCDGRTVEGSGTCPPEPWAYAGACRDPITPEACEAEGGVVAWPIGPPASCPEGKRPVAQVGPAGIEGYGLCCR